MRSKLLIRRFSEVCVIRIFNRRVWRPALALALIISSGAPAAAGSLPLPFARTAHAAVQRPQPWVSPHLATLATTKGLVFINNEAWVDIFAQGDLKTVQGQITRGLQNPLGMAVDGKGELYVADIVTGNVTSYKPPYTKLTRTYRISLPFNEYLYDVAVHPDGTLYVATSVGIYEYPPDSNVLKLTIPFAHSSGGGFVGVAVDAAKNVYVGVAGSQNNTCGASVPGSATEYEFLAGQTTGTAFSIPGLGGMGDMVLDQNGNLLVAQCTSPGLPSAVFVEPLAHRGQTPTTIYQPNFLGTNALAFNKARTRLYVGNMGNSDVEELTYPAGQVVDRVTGSEIQYNPGWGVAVYPPPQ